MNSPMTSDIPRSYQSSLYKIQLQDSLTCVEVLKITQTERTEKVVDQAGTVYIRKYIPKTSHALTTAAQLMGLESNNLPKILTFYTLGKQIVLIIEYIEGITLRSYIDNVGCLSLDSTLKLLKGVFTGIEDLHSAKPDPIIHRDINPNNIIVCNENTTKLVDYGLTRTYVKSAVSDTQHWGTKGYISPEQVGFGKSSIRSDIYSLASTIFFCLTAKDPYTNMETSLISSNLLPDIQNVLSKATSLSIDKRQATTSELLNDLIKTNKEEKALNKQNKYPSYKENETTSPTTKQLVEQKTNLEMVQSHSLILKTPLSIAWKAFLGLAYIVFFASSLQNYRGALVLGQPEFVVYLVQLFVVDIFLLLPISIAIAFMPEFFKRRGMFASKRFLVLGAFIAGSFLVTFLIFLVMNITVEPNVIQSVASYNNSLSS